MISSFAQRNDPFFLGNGFEVVSEYNFALIKKQKIDITDFSLIPYHLTSFNDKKNKNCGVHFFIDDLRFKECFEKPEISFKRICSYRFAFSPDASLYKEMPKWKIIENVGKSRWYGAYLQSKGMTVIPTLSWTGLSDIDICTAGIEEGCVIAVSTVGCKLSKYDFLLCYDRVIERIKPPAIICVGKPFKEMNGDIVTINYSRTKKILTKNEIHENLDFNYDEEPMLPFEEFMKSKS